MADKETVTLKLPTGEEVDFIVPAGLSDSQVKGYVLSKRPDLFTTQQQNDEIPLTSHGNATLSGLQSIGSGVADAAKGILDMVQPPSGTAEKGISAISPAALPLYRAIKGLAQGTAGVSQVPGAIRDINQTPDPLGTYAKVAQQTAGQGAGQALTALAGEGVVRGINAIPSAARAGEAFSRVSKIAADTPVDMNAAGQIAQDTQRLQQLTRQRMPSVMRGFLSKMKSGGELTYKEARELESAASRLSAQEMQSYSPIMQRQLALFRQQLRGSIEDALTKAHGEQVTNNFRGALKEYSRAARLADARAFSKELALKEVPKAVAKGVGLGAGGAAVYKIARELSNR